MEEIKLPDIDYKEEVKKCKTMEDVVGRNVLLQRLLKDVIQNMLEAEMEELLGREKYQGSEDSKNKNYRNGCSKKSIRSSVGDVNLDIPRERNADFEPKVVKKYENVCNELEELYGIDVSPTMISKITDKVMDSAAQWQNRILDDVYPIVYMDAIHFKVKEKNKIVTKVAYICRALDMKGYKDILGIWIGEAEGAKFRLQFAMI